MRLSNLWKLVANDSYLCFQLQYTIYSNVNREENLYQDQQKSFNLTTLVCYGVEEPQIYAVGKIRLTLGFKSCISKLP